jgi:hypothetical protein
VLDEKDRSTQPKGLFMAKRLAVKHAKRRRDQATAYKADGRPTPHKIGEARSKKAKAKNANRAH